MTWSPSLPAAAPGGGSDSEDLPESYRPTAFRNRCGPSELFANAGRECKELARAYFPGRQVEERGPWLCRGGASRRSSLGGHYSTILVE